MERGKSVATPEDNDRFSGIDARRSTRLECVIPLIIMGKDKLGELSQETDRKSVV